MVPYLQVYNHTSESWENPHKTLPASLPSTKHSSIVISISTQTITKRQQVHAGFIVFTFCASLSLFFEARGYFSCVIS